MMAPMGSAAAAAPFLVEECVEVAVDAPEVEEPETSRV